VLVLAGVLALLFKTLDDDDDDVGERHNNGKLAQDEEFTDENLIKLSKYTAYLDHMIVVM
jgi:hypothetical protein